MMGCICVPHIRLEHTLIRIGTEYLAFIQIQIKARTFVNQIGQNIADNRLIREQIDSSLPFNRTSFIIYIYIHDVC